MKFSAFVLFVSSTISFQNNLTLRTGVQRLASQSVELQTLTDANTQLTNAL